MGASHSATLSIFSNRCINMKEYERRSRLLKEMNVMANTFKHTQYRARTHTHAARKMETFFVSFMILFFIFISLYEMFLPSPNKKQREKYVRQSAVVLKMKKRKKIVKTNSHISLMYSYTFPIFSHIKTFHVICCSQL